MRYWIPAYFFAHVLQAIHSLYDDVPHVVSEFASVSDFESQVLSDSTSVWLISLYSSSGCDACEAIAGPFGETSLELSESLGIRTAAIDVSGGVGQKLAKKLSIGQVPMVFGYSSESSINPYTNKANREMQVFMDLLQSGMFKANDLKRWVSSTLLPKGLVKRGSEAIASSPLPTVALITERSTTSALAKSLAVALRNRLQIVELSSTEAEPFSDIDDDLPKLVAIGKDDDSAETYGGSLKNREELLAWLETKALSEPMQPKKETKKEASPSEDSAANDSIYGSQYVAPIVTTAAELSNLWSRSGLLLAPVDAKPAPNDVSRLLESLDGSGLVRAASCGAEFADVCDSEFWRAFDVGGKLLIKASSAKDALDAVLSAVPATHVTLLGDGPASTEEFMQRAIEPAMQRDITLDESEVPPPLGIIVFSNSEQPSIHVRALATVLTASLNVAVAQYVVTSSAQDASVLQRFGIQKAPAVVAFHGQPSDEGPKGAVQLGLAPYDRRNFGPPTFRSLATFVQVLLQQLKPTDAEKLATFVIEEATGFLNSKEGSDASSSFTRQKNSGELIDLNQRGLDSIGCGASSENGGAQLCAIFLLDQVGRPETFAAELAIAKDVTVAEATAPYHFGWLDGQCHLDLALAYDIDPMKLPTLVAYAPKKQRFAAYVGQFNAKDLKSFLRSVVSGRIPTTPTRYALPPIDTTKDCTVVSEQATNDDASVQDDEELDDFMAEILAEEAAKKRQLEEEANAELERMAEEKRLQDQAKKDESERATKKKTSTKKKKKKKSSSKKSSTDL